MIGQFTARSTATDSRIFVYEVAGLQQNEATEAYSTPIRSSDRQFIQVPFGRMNEAMQQITMMQGKIVNIFPLGSQPLVGSNDATSNGAEPNPANDSTDKD
ncbi:MAG: phycobilisome linker polypeptide [Cyanobacteria bacterium J06607_13]